MARIVTYECEQCGSEIIVTETGETRLSPIYCCGTAITQVSSVEKRPKPKKSAAKKITKKKVAEKKPSKKKPR